MGTSHLIARYAVLRSLRYCPYWLGSRLRGKEPLESFEFEARLLYPDVAKIGLPALLQSELDRMAPDLGPAEPCESLHWRAARLEHRGRRAQVHCAHAERAFFLELSAEGTTEKLAGWTGAMSEVARAIRDWLSEETPDFEALAATFPFLEADEFARAYERGEAIEYRWRQLLDHPPVESLRPLIETVAREPRLRRLFPYTSLDHLHFSRWVTYPFSFDLPCAVPHGERFRVISASEVVLGEGHAARAVELLAAGLPEPVEVFKRGPVWRLPGAVVEGPSSRELVWALAQRSRPDHPLETFSGYEEAEAFRRALPSAESALAEELTVVALERVFLEN